jgi:hypothetical protein
MSASVRRTLPARANLEQQRKLAKELLAAFRANEAEALARVRAQLPDKTRIVLADTQFVLAREYGFGSWRELAERIAALESESRPPIERFKNAVQDGDARSVRALLKEHPDVRAAINSPIFGFDSPALVAVGDHPDVVDVLVEFGADPNRKSEWWAGGFHPLYGATPRVAERLLVAGATPDACAAAHLDRPDLLAGLLAQDPSRAHERGGDGKTPLHFAHSRRIADMLLDAGADIDARDIDHRSTAAEWMIGTEGPDRSRLELAKYLVERGASTDIFLCAALGLTERAREMLQRNPSLLRLRTSQGDYAEKRPSSYHIYQWTIGPNLTPLQVASKFGQRETLDVMLTFAPTDQRLLLACHEGRADDARRIVRENAGIVERLAPDDARALTDEAWLPNPRAVELMMELGFDPSIPSVTGPTGGNALHCAAWEGSVESVEAILRYPSGRAIIEAREPVWGGTPLSWCCHGSRNCGNPNADHAAVARLLIEAGARVDSGLDSCAPAMQAVLDAAASGASSTI